MLQGFHCKVLVVCHGVGSYCLILCFLNSQGGIFSTLRVSDHVSRCDQFPQIFVLVMVVIDDEVSLLDYAATTFDLWLMFVAIDSQTLIKLTLYRPSVVELRFIARLLRHEDQLFIQDLCLVPYFLLLCGMFLEITVDALLIIFVATAYSVFANHLLVLLPLGLW